MVLIFCAFSYISFPLGSQQHKISGWKWWCAGEAQVDAHSILLTFCAFIYVSFPLGVSTAATIRVGNLVGAGRPSEARLAGLCLLHHIMSLSRC